MLRTGAGYLNLVLLPSKVLPDPLVKHDVIANHTHRNHSGQRLISQVDMHPEALVARRLEPANLRALPKFSISLQGTMGMNLELNGADNPQQSLHTGDKHW